MVRKPIFIGITDAEVRMRGLAGKKAGDTFNFNAARPAVFGSEIRTCRGVIVAVYETAHGKTFILRNSHQGNDDYHCSGWKYIPVFLGCGQSGIVAHWKDLETASHLEAQRAEDAWEVWYAEHLRERELSRAMAL